jgi:hypothetical protein
MLRTMSVKTVVAAIALASVLAITGCAAVTKSMPGVGLGPVTLESLDRDEYVVLDSTTGSCETVHFLCFNNRMFGRTEAGSVNIGIQAELAPFPLNILIQLMGGGTSDVGGAVYNALTKVPEADAVIPLTMETETSGLKPIVWTTRARVKGKAIKIKSDSELN